MDKTVFQKIIDRELPATIRYENDTFIIIDSIKPVAPTHCLIIPKKLIPSIQEAHEDDRDTLGSMLLLAAHFAREQGYPHYKLAFNAGKYLNVPHLHLHLLAGDHLEHLHGDHT